MDPSDDIDGYTFLAEEAFECVGIVDMVPVYRNDLFARALELEDGERDVRTEFVLVPGGAASIGLTDPTYEAAKARFETALDLRHSRPIREVEVPSFLIGRTTITQGVFDGIAEILDIELWDQRTGESPYLPVTGITWSSVQEFLEGASVRLPTEVEWEYACRAGRDALFYWGDDDGFAFEHAWYDHGAVGGPMGSAQKKENAWGLFDMAGNVWELCRDWWHPTYRGAPDDARAWTGDDDPMLRVMRGGSFRSDSVLELCSALRSEAGIYHSGIDVGFRGAASVGDDGVSR